MVMSVDVTFLLQAVDGVAVVLVPVILGWVAKEAITFFRISNNSAIAARITEGVNALSDIALARLHTMALTGETVDVNNLIGGVLNEASEGLLYACKAQGTTPESLAARVTGSLITKASAAPPVRVKSNAA